MIKRLLTVFQLGEVDRRARLMSNQSEDIKLREVMKIIADLKGKMSNLSPEERTEMSRTVDKLIEMITKDVHRGHRWSQGSTQFTMKQDNSLTTSPSGVVCFLLSGPYSHLGQRCSGCS